MQESYISGKDDTGKLQLSLVPMQIVKDIAEVRMFGNKKYHGSDNWKHVDVSKFIDAMLRHTLEFINDHDSIDAESGLPHYKHIACNLAFICDMMNRGAEK